MSYQEALERSIETFTAISEATSEADDLATELIHIQATRAATEALALADLSFLNLRIAERNRDSSRGLSTDELLSLIDETLDATRREVRTSPGTD